MAYIIIIECPELSSRRVKYMIGIVVNWRIILADCCPGSAKRTGNMNSTYLYAYFSYEKKPYTFAGYFLISPVVDCSVQSSLQHVFYNNKDNIDE